MNLGRILIFLATLLYAMAPTFFSRHNDHNKQRVGRSRHLPVLRKGGEGRGEISTSLADGQLINPKHVTSPDYRQLRNLFYAKKTYRHFCPKYFAPKIVIFPSNCLRTKHLFTYKAPACGSITYTKPETLM